MYEETKNKEACYFYSRKCKKKIVQAPISLCSLEAKKAFMRYRLKMA